MSVQDRLDYWRSERLRLLSEMALGRRNMRQVLPELEADLAQAESFIRYYEGRIPGAGAERP